MATGELFQVGEWENRHSLRQKLLDGLDRLFLVQANGEWLTGFAPTTVTVRLGHGENETDFDTGRILAGETGSGDYIGVLARVNILAERYPDSQFFFAIGQATSRAGLVLLDNDFEWINQLPDANDRLPNVERSDRYTLGQLSRTVFTPDATNDFALSLDVSDGPDSSGGLAQV